jgi:hypothetical protein
MWSQRFALIQEVHCIKHFIYLGLLGYWFWDNFFFRIAVVFPSHSISDLSHISFICYHHYIILTALCNITVPCLSIHPSIHPSMHSAIHLSHLSHLSIYSHPSLPLLMSQTSVAYYVHTCWCATFIFGKHQSNSIHLLIDYNFLLTQLYFLIRVFLPITQL